ncbi:hypothetical protein [Roseibium aggregatum]|uniref:Secreted protein n=1 Tax=Roseibium aggregatum TaxID=187304 RepID=A0A939EDZ3_9HYPH|nr:hypothetical protein [Roseibium aggregatum]MBN9671462.1 hypothetical protein [Roseibium aggregatum]
MNFLTRTVAAALTAFGLMTGAASAAPVINFDVAGASGGSSVSVSGFNGLFSVGSISANLASGLDSTVFSLAKGESKTFDFFTLSTDGGAGKYSVSATLAFDDPSGTGTADASGGGKAISFFGIVSLGKLFWQAGSLPDYLFTSNGSLFSVDFADGVALVLGGTATITATVTAIEVVPVPAALVLMLSGLFGLGVFSRFRGSRSAPTA